MRIGRRTATTAIRAVEEVCLANLGHGRTEASASIAMPAHEFLGVSNLDAESKISTNVTGVGPYRPGFPDCIAFKAKESHLCDSTRLARTT